MPVFNVSFANKNFKKSTQDYGFLVDQLDIKENQLAADGKLSPGDYDLLKKQAQALYTHPGLTPAQRSNIEVKISSYDKSKNVTTLNDNSNISDLNNDVKNDMATIGLRYANDPVKFLSAKSTLLAAKIDRLSSAVDSMKAAGDDPADHLNELTSTINDYQDTRQALSDVSTYDKSGTSKSDFAAYLVTNSKGEITDIKIDRIGANSGYLQTNGLYGGLQVYGKVNNTPNGQSTFKLGNTTFTQSSQIVTGPDGVTQQKLLIAGGGGRGGITINGKNVDVDPTTVKTQSYVPTGGWIEGSKGFLYKNNGDGSYTKYVNSDQEKLGINPGDIIRVPGDFEANITSKVKTTVDGSVPVPPPTPPPAASFPTPATPAPATTTPTATPAPTTVSDPQTNPIKRAASSVYNIANAAGEKAKGFFANLFNQ